MAGGHKQNTDIIDFYRKKFDMEALLKELNMIQIDLVILCLVKFEDKERILLS